MRRFSLPLLLSLFQYSFTWKYILSFCANIGKRPVIDLYAKEVEEKEEKNLRPKGSSDDNVLIICVFF